MIVLSRFLHCCSAAAAISAAAISSDEFSARLPPCRLILSFQAVSCFRFVFGGSINPSLLCKTVAHFTQATPLDACAGCAVKSKWKISLTEVFYYDFIFLGSDPDWIRVHWSFCAWGQMNLPRFFYIAGSEGKHEIWPLLLKALSDLKLSAAQSSSEL